MTEPSDDLATDGSSGPSSPAVVTKEKRAGGLLRSPKGEMTPVFTALMSVLYFDVLFLLLLPYVLGYSSDSAWASRSRLAFLGVSIFSGLCFGTLASVVAERRNHSAWWFLAGHIGAWVAPVLALANMDQSSPFAARMVVFGAGLAGTLICFFAVQAFPRSFKPPTLPTRLLGRAWFKTGNIWFGLGLLAILALALHLGTWWEDAYGSKSAHAVIYASWWFGLLLLVFSASLIAATLRKYPFRIDQTGWIVVHISLVMIIVGSYVSYWGKDDGVLSLMEGRSTSEFSLHTRTRLELHEVRTIGDRQKFVPVWSALTTFDDDPSNDEPNVTYEVQEGGETLTTLNVEKFWGDARQEILRSDDNSSPRFALEVDVKLPGGGMDDRLLVESQGRDTQRAADRLGGFLELNLLRIESPLRVQSLKGGRPQDATGHGELVVKDASGKELLRTKVVPGARQSVRGAPASLKALDLEIPGTDVRLKGSAWYDGYTINTQQKLAYDDSPGAPHFPACEFFLSGPDGTDPRRAFAFEPDFSDNPRGHKIYKNLRVYLDYIPPYPLSGRTIAFVHPGNNEDAFWIIGGRERRIGKIIEGQPLGLSGPLQIIPKKIFHNFREEAIWKFRAHKPDDFQIAVIRVGDEEKYVRLGEDGRVGLTIDGRDFRLRWVRETRPLGFKLTLRDFHRDYYPGTTEAKTFESYLWLEDHAKAAQKPLPVKIDMNHPLRLDGLRLFQHRFQADREGRLSGAELTVLQVNRDPGLWFLYPACALLSLGLVIVFFQKPFLRALGRWMEGRRMNLVPRFAAAVIVVALSLAACVPGLIVMSILPEGPMLIVSVGIIILGLFIETMMLNRVLKPRLARAHSGAAS